MIAGDCGMATGNGRQIRGCVRGGLHARLSFVVMNSAGLSITRSPARRMRTYPFTVVRIPRESEAAPLQLLVELSS